MAQINKPNTHFNTVLYNGSASTQNITGVNFQPDLVWIKTRSHAESHQLVDQVRGATKALMSNETSAEATYANGLSAFLSDGFTLPGGNNRYSDTGYTYVSWNWKAGGTGVSNTDGSITSTVSANTTSGFSIVSYTGNQTSGATVGHSLGVAPSVIIVKDRSSAQDWFVYHSALGNTKNLRLNGTGAAGTGTEWNNTTPSSSVFTLGLNGGVNGNSLNFIAYCFAEKKGFSKFGSYVGNGSADGPFIYTGFKPAMIITKKTSVSGDNWQIRDNKRDTYNEANRLLKPNASTAEQTTDAMDYYSNGFKWRNSAGEVNASGATFIYMAFAENPLVGTNNVPACAR